MELTHLQRGNTRNQLERVKGLSPQEIDLVLELIEAFEIDPTHGYPQFKLNLSEWFHRLHAAIPQGY